MTCIQGRLMLMLLMLAILLNLQIAYAQESDLPLPETSREAPKKESNSKTKKQTIDFEDQLVEGTRQKPELFYILQNKEFNFKRLIRLREDFLPEMRKSSEDIQGRAGSGQ